MEKDGVGILPPIVKQASEDWSVVEPYEVDDAHDVEETKDRPDLNRVVSGPPYTIFSPKTKMFIVLSVSVSGLISPFGAVTFYPALNVLAEQLNVTPSMINIALTTYMASLLWPTEVQWLASNLI